MSGLAIFVLTISLWASGVAITRGLGILAAVVAAEVVGAVIKEIFKEKKS